MAHLELWPSDLFMGNMWWCIMCDPCNVSVAYQMDVVSGLQYFLVTSHPHRFRFPIMWMDMVSGLQCVCVLHDASLTFYICVLVVHDVSIKSGFDFMVHGWTCLSGMHCVVVIYEVCLSCLGCTSCFVDGRGVWASMFCGYTWSIPGMSELHFMLHRLTWCLDCMELWCMTYPYHSWSGTSCFLDGLCVWAALCCVVHVFIKSGLHFMFHGWTWCLSCTVLWLYMTYTYHVWVAPHGSWMDVVSGLHCVRVIHGISLSCLGCTSLFMDENVMCCHLPVLNAIKWLTDGSTSMDSMPLPVHHGQRSSDHEKVGCKFT